MSECHRLNALLPHRSYHLSESWHARPVTHFGSAGSLTKRKQEYKQEYKQGRDRVRSSIPYLWQEYYSDGAFGVGLDDASQWADAEGVVVGGFGTQLWVRQVRDQAGYPSRKVWLVKSQLAIMPSLLHI